MIDWPRRVSSVLATLRSSEPPPVGAPAAVLVPLFVSDGVLRVWLLRRATHLRHHPGQVALPGGKPEAQDASLRESALREAHEEIGLEPSCVELVGQLPPRLTSTRFLVVPFVGFVPPSFSPVIQASEADRAFAAPLCDFAREEQLRVPPSMPERGPVPSFQSEGEVVWGATAAILTRLARACFPEAQ